MIVKEFKGYTFGNKIRICDINPIDTNTIIFDVKLLNPDTAAQIIANDILRKLHSAVSPAFHKNTEEMWKEIKIVTIGDEKEAKEMVKKHLRKICERTEDDNSGNLNLLG